MGVLTLYDKNDIVSYRGVVALHLEMAMKKEDHWLWWQTRSFLGITRNGWVWIVITCALLTSLYSFNWDFIFGLRK